MGNHRPPGSEMLRLLEEVQDTGTNIFEVLDLEDHEKRLTRFLAWLLDPNSGHNAEQAFLHAFVNCFDISLTDTTNVDVHYLESFSSDDYGNCEIDFVIETGPEVLGVEIKTTHTEEKGKFEEEARVLAAKNEEKAAKMLYLPHLRSEEQKAEYADYIASWEDVLAALSSVRGELKTPYQVALFDNFVTNIKQHVVEQEAAFSKESELYLKFHDRLDEFDVDIGPNSYQNGSC